MVRRLLIAAAMGLLGCTVITSLFSASQLPVSSSTMNNISAGASSHQAKAASTLSLNYYFPIAVNRYPLTTVFGMQILLGHLPYGFQDLSQLQASWVRYHNLDWSLVEPERGERLWENLYLLENGLLQASNAGIKVLLIVHGTPAWAQTIEGATCSRVQTQELSSFAGFLNDAVARYSKPPYNVKYWEIWNEPDIGYTEDLAIEPFGCWADYNDDYWGGRYYADVLKAIYPRMKAANPQVQVIIGGLHLDCDPRPESNYCAAVGHDERQPKYLEGILVNGGADYFDGVGFHAYDYFHQWDPQIGRYSNINWGSGWETTGPVISAKADYIRSVLAAYQVSGKFLMNTEGALICGVIGAPDGDDGCESDDTSAYEQTKARYIAQLYASAIASDLLTNIWYQIFGFRNSALVDPQDFILRPAYYSYQFARSELADAVFQREIDDYPNIRVYEFLREDRKIWLMWALDEYNYSVGLPGLPVAVYDYMGYALTPAITLNVTLDPIYVEWMP